jgi:hypothetical protein
LTSYRFSSTFPSKEKVHLKFLYSRCGGALTSLPSDLPAYTMGNQVSAAAAAMIVRRILQPTASDLTRLRAAFVGLGPVGSSILRLLLRVLLHPTELILTDPHAHPSRLETMAREVTAAGYGGKLSVTAWEALRQSDCQGADLHLWAAPLPDAEYLQRFGRKNISLS